MANLHLVTGYAGYEHIKATDQGAFNAALIGTGQFVLEKGSIFEAQVRTSNLVRVLDGELMMQGRFVRLEPDTYADLTIENGEQGKLRNDIIVARYTKDIGTGVEECNLVVIKGEAVDSDPVDPTHEEGDITNGVDTVHDFPLWRIPVDGLNVGEPVALYGLPFMDSMQTLHTIREDVNQQLAEQEEQFESAIEAFGGYTKAETLSNETKGLFGMDTASVPDNVFSWLSKYKKYWWKRRIPAHISESEEQTISLTFSTSSGSQSMSYGSSVVYEAGALGFGGSSSSSGIAYNSYSFLTGAKGNYVKFQQSTGGYLWFYYPSTSANPKQVSSSYTLTVTGRLVTYAEDGEWEYLSSTDRNAYPDSGTSGDFEYVYLGIPFDSTIDPVRIESGTYVGTGTYGEENPTSLTFNFVPKLLVIQDDGTPIGSGNNFMELVVLVNNIPSFGMECYRNSSTTTNNVTWGTTVSWYHTSTNSSYLLAYRQLNHSNKKYCYIAIG